MKKGLAPLIIFSAFVLSLCAGLSAPLGVHADLNSALIGGGTETHTLLTNLSGDVATIKTPGQVIFNIVSIILGFLGIVGVGLMMYGGFLWLTAGGEEEKAKQGSTLLFQAFIGSAIILSAYMVTYFVLAQLTTAVTH